MTAGKGRGRPRKLPDPAFLTCPPPWVKSAAPSSWNGPLVSTLDALEKKLIKDYRHSPLVSHKHALDLALFQELGTGEQRRVSEVDAVLRARSVKRRHEGGAKTQRTWERRRRKIMARNADLVIEVRRSASGAARIIASNWADRGDGDTCPNAFTLARWIRAERKLARSLSPGN